MILETILKKLDFFTNELPPEVLQYTFYHVEVLTQSHIYQSETCYLSEYEPEGLPESAFCIVLSDSTAVSDERKNIFFLNTTMNLRELCDRIQEYMLEDYAILDMQIKISGYFARMNSLGEIMEQISRELSTPLALFDCTGKLLAVSSTFPEIRDDLKEQQDMGYILLENFRKMQENQIFTKLRTNDSNSYIDINDEHHHLWYHAGIRYRQMNLAYFAAVSSGNCFTEKQLRIFEYVQTQLIQYLSQPLPSDGLRNIKYAQFFFDLMNGTIDNLVFLDYRLKILGWKPKEHFCLLTVYSEDPQKRPLITASLILKFFHDKKYFFYEDKVLFVLDYNEIKSILACLDSTYFRQMLKSNSLKCTLSREFSSLLELRSFYEQSLTLLRIGDQVKPEEVVYAYTHYMFPIMLDSVQHHMNLDDFIHPMIQRIYQYDCDHKSDFLETLCAYLVAPKDSAKSAQILNIHKNTFNYRINRIKDLYSLDLADGDLCFRLLFSIQVLEFKYRISILEKYVK